jgi:GTP:adenosylcobinamide-phosphate guanylyltransferase
MIWEAVLLAGGKLEEAFAPFGPAPGKAYLLLNGKRMADYVLDVLINVPRIRRIVAVIPKGANAFPNTHAVAGGETLMESLSAGFQVLKSETTLALVATADIPFLTKEALENFMNACEKEEAGFYYSFVSQIDSEKKFPGIPHTYVKLKEGRFCGGGLLAIAPKNFSSLKKFAEEATQKRKNIFALAKIFGVSFLLKLLLGRLSIQEVEKRASQLLGFPAKGILSPYPEVAFNIDDPKTLKLGLNFLKNKRF